MLLHQGASRDMTYMQVFQEMVWKGCERSVITYSSLISACEKAGHWELAMELFNEMHQEGCTPNTVTYNSLITACAQGYIPLPPFPPCCHSPTHPSSPHHAFTQNPHAILPPPPPHPCLSPHANTALMYSYTKRLIHCLFFLKLQKDKGLQH